MQALQVGIEELPLSGKATSLKQPLQRATHGNRNPSTSLAKGTIGDKAAASASNSEMSILEIFSDVIAARSSICVEKSASASPRDSLASFATWEIDCNARVIANVSCGRALAVKSSTFESPSRMVVGANRFIMQRLNH